MKAKNIILTISLVLVCAGTGLAGDADSDDARPFIGVMLDASPLPDLLVKHLNLQPGQGIRIANIHRGSPADKAGLERDDIIIGFEEGQVTDHQEFVDNVRSSGIGTEISLEVIHLGKRKTVKLTLKGLRGQFDLKYPPEPRVEQSWRPGKIFKLKPGEEDWMEMFKDNMPSDLDINVKKFFKEIYTYKHSSDGEDYTVTIEGNPNDENTTISISAGDNEYKTTLKEIDKLPEKYRESAEQAVKDARSAWFGKKFNPPSFDLKHDFDNLKLNIKPPVMPFGPGDEMFETITKQMQELQKRLDELEKWQQKKCESDEPAEPESQQQKDWLLQDQENQKSG